MPINHLPAELWPVTCRAPEANAKSVAALLALYCRFPCNDDLQALGWDQKRIDLAEAEMDAARKALIEAGAIKY
jgi:hypothetical protein